MSHNMFVPTACTIVHRLLAVALLGFASGLTDDAVAGWNAETTSTLIPPSGPAVLTALALDIDSVTSVSCSGAVIGVASGPGVVDLAASSPPVLDIPTGTACHLILDLDGPVEFEVYLPDTGTWMTASLDVGQVHVSVPGSATFGSFGSATAITIASAGWLAGLGLPAGHVSLVETDAAYATLVERLESDSTLSPL